MSQANPFSASPTRPAVLVVDDVQANLVAIEALLDELDCDLVAVRSGNAALAQLTKRPFAMMLLDVQMPDMNGYEVAQLARSNPKTCEIPIIFVTASHNSWEHTLRGYGAGAVDYLYKPLEPTVVRSKVRVFLELYTSRMRLQATQSHLVQAAKMAALGELVAGVAHEINNPLAFIGAHLDTVRRNLDRIAPEVDEALSDGSSQRWTRAVDRMGEMQLGLERMRELVLKLRTFSRLDEGVRKLVNVPESIDSVMTIVGHRLGDDIRLAIEHRGPHSIECYPGLLNQAVMNLVVNAIDAIDGAGELAITTGARGDRYEIAVADSGPGVPASIRDRIFEPFYTTKPVGQGTGLGLSIAYSIVQKHGGTLTVADQPGGGALMTIDLPVTG